MALVVYGAVFSKQGSRAACLGSSGCYDQAGLIDANDAYFQNDPCSLRSLAHRELDVARAACDVALILAPQDAAILDSRGLVGLKQGRFSDA